MTISKRWKNLERTVANQIGRRLGKVIESVISQETNITLCQTIQPNERLNEIDIAHSQYKLCARANHNQPTNRRDMRSFITCVCPYCCPPLSLNGKEVQSNNDDDCKTQQWALTIANELLSRGTEVLCVH